MIKYLKLFNNMEGLQNPSDRVLRTNITEIGGMKITYLVFPQSAIHIPNFVFLHRLQSGRVVYVLSDAIPAELQPYFAYSQALIDKMQAREQGVDNWEAELNTLRFVPQTCEDEYINRKMEYYKYIVTGYENEYNAEDPVIRTMVSEVKDAIAFLSIDRQERYFLINLAKVLTRDLGTQRRQRVTVTESLTLEEERQLKLKGITHLYGDLTGTQGEYFARKLMAKYLPLVK